MAYTATVTLDHPQPVHLNRFYSIITGTVTVSEYHATFAEITGITKFFKKLFVVIPDSVTTTGYLLDWDYTTKAFKGWRGDYTSGASGPLVEAANADNLGTAKFIAIGIGAY